MELKLGQQNVVVVGAAQGIGLAIAEAFIDEHANVALWDLKPSVQDVARQLDQNSNATVCGLLADVTSAESVAAATAASIEKLGSIQHLVYAAGAGSGKHGFPFWNLQPEDWPRILDINLVGAVRVLQSLVETLIQSDCGSVLMIASIAGQIGSQTDPPYSAAKAGLINFTQCAARDLAVHQVRVNAIAPGMIKTELNRAVWEAWSAGQTEDQRASYDDWAAEKISRVSPLGRWQEADDVAQMAVMLASARSKNITGQTINVDGGQVMR